MSVGDRYQEFARYWSPARDAWYLSFSIDLNTVASHVPNSTVLIGDTNPEHIRIVVMRLDVHSSGSDHSPTAIESVDSDVRRAS